MKSKLILGIALIVTLTAVVLLWSRQRSAKSTAKLGQSTVISSPGAFPMGAVPISSGVKMTTVTGKPPSPKSGPLTGNWPTIQVIVDPQADLEQRIGEIGLLSSHLTEQDWLSLKGFLLKASSSDQNQLGQILKNNLMDALCALNPPPAGLGDMLMSLYRDREQNAVLRDYAVQHMVPYYEQLRLQNNHSQPEQEITKALWEATDETGDSIAPTALLALEHLSQEYGADFDQDKIASTALQLAKDYGAGELTHITAFQVCAQLGVADAFPIILQAAQKSDTISEKISAVAALGLLGGADQISFLNSLLDGTEDRLKPAARHALDQIMARQNQTANQK